MRNLLASLIKSKDSWSDLIIAQITSVGRLVRFISSIFGDTVYRDGILSISKARKLGAVGLYWDLIRARHFTLKDRINFLSLLVFIIFLNFSTFNFYIIPVEVRHASLWTPTRSNQTDHRKRTRFHRFHEIGECIVNRRIMIWSDWISDLKSMEHPLSGVFERSKKTTRN